MGSKSALFLLLISAVLYTTLATSVDWKSSLLHKYANLKQFAPEDPVCETDGFSCIDCQTSLYCFKPPVGDWISNSQTCVTGETCFPDERRCSNEPNPDCVSRPPFRMTCYQPGFFPHPYDSSTYYYCDDDLIGSSDEPSALKCEAGTVFDSLTSFCRTISDESDIIILGSCPNIGAAGGIKGNPFLFYICLPATIDGSQQIIPNLFRCGPNERYIGADRCTPKPEGLDEGAKCPSVGKFQDASACWKYHDCVTVGEDPEEGICAIGESFDAWTKECAPINCLLS